MTASVRLADICSGHGCWPPRPNNQASSDVFVNGRGAHRQGDSYQVHCCGIPCHGSVAAAGSPTVFVNGKQKTRIGDPVACGSSMATGSPNVFVGP